jgi:glycosyltransferase involved in cell wall biosynthesis
VLHLLLELRPHHPTGGAYPGYKNKLIHVDYKDGIKAIKILTYITANEDFVKRTFNYIFYMVMAIVVAPFLSKTDIVISTSQQFFNGLAGYFFSRLKRAPWVLEIRDLWPESIVAVGAIENKKLVGLLEWIERFLYRKADHIVPVSHAFKTHIFSRGGNANKVTVIRNGADLSLFNERTPDTDYAKQIAVENRFVASYVGTHGMAHGLDTLIEAVELLLRREDIVFLLAGDGSERLRLAAEVKSRNLSNVVMLGQLPKTDMPRLWSASNVSLVLLRKLDLFLTVIPSKIFESMAMKKPIILGVQGESKEIIDQAKAGITIEPENAVALAEAVIKLANSEVLCKDIGECGNRYVAEHFDRIKLATVYESVLRKTAGYDDSPYQNERN